MHAAPPVPQLVVADWLAYGTQVPLLVAVQQPDGHDAALQTQVPVPSQVCPVEHVEHAAPFTPHMPLLEVWHLLALSQHPEQDDESQTHLPVVVLQCCPGKHAEHAAPPAPHVPTSSLAYPTHVFPLQQPLGQDPGLHTHEPPAQVCPAVHVTHAAPPVPQVAVPEVWHWPLESQHPDGHDVASHTHLPCVPHSWLAAHVVHTPPPTPHAVVDGVVLHTPPLVQHPLQEVPPQLHAPLLHDCIAAQVPQALPFDPHALVD
jgi:hypothetical protein